MYAIPYEWYEKYHIRKYGAHGTSHKYVATRCAALMGRPIEDLKIVTCHLGNGASLCAIEDGKCIDGYRFTGGEFEEELKVHQALESASLLDRERALDNLSWEKIASLETFHYFDLTAVLAYVCKLHIVDRWLALDEEMGRELFRKLVQEVPLRAGSRP